MPNYALEGPKWSASVVTWSFASAGGDFSGAITGAYQSTVRAAIARWGQVANLTFKEVADSATTNVRIGWGQFTNGQIGETNYSFVPSSNAEVFRNGTTVRLQDPSTRSLGTGIGDYYQGTATTLFETVLHEFGHALGLAHSTDPNAVLYPNVGPADNDLGISDILGIQAIYGTNPAAATTTATLNPTVATLNPTAATTTPTSTTTTSSTASTGDGAIAVYRFFDARTGTQFLTANPAERNAVLATRPDLAYEGVGMGALSSPAGDPYAVPVYRFFDTQTGSHFFTTSASENATIIATRPDLISEPASFYEHSVQQAGDVPVFRFFDASTGAHFFTSSSAEKDQIQSSRPDMTLEGVAFYAPTASASSLPQTSTAAAHADPGVVTLSADTLLVYRYDGADGRQFLSADTAEGSAALIASPSLVAAGPAMGAVSPDEDATAAPVFRFFNAATGDHFLTASATEAAQLTATRPDFVQEQTAFYEHLTQSHGDVPVYRFFDAATGTHFYTASESEHASILATRPEMAAEGIAFYAPSIKG